MKKSDIMNSKMFLMIDIEAAPELVSSIDRLFKGTVHPEQAMSFFSP